MSRPSAFIWLSFANVKKLAHAFSMGYQALVVQAQLDFGSSPSPSYETEGIKYAGSKREIIPGILTVATTLGAKTVLDGFSGTTRVSQALARSGCTVISNDIAAWSYNFALAYLRNTKPLSYYQPIIEHLNHLPGKDGWFTENYGGSGDSRFSDERDGYKKIWQIHNTRKLDSIREEIDRLALEPIEKAVLLTSLMLAMDKVDSTVGHQVSYLKEWAPRSYNTMRMQVPQLLLNQMPHVVSRSDIFDVLPNHTVDLAYFDPPYGSSNEKMPPSRVRYASYYHLWTTICLNDHPPVVGAARRRKDASDTIAASVFEEFRKNDSGRYIVIDAIENLIKHTRANYVVLSYSNQGRATRSELLKLISDLGYQSAVLELDHKSNVMMSMRWTNEWTTEHSEKVKEYLFVLSKDADLTALSKVDISRKRHKNLSR